MSRYRGSRRWSHAQSRRARDQAHTEQLPLRILLAEDDTDMRHLLASGLRREGWEVIEASTGIELLEYIANQLLRPRQEVPVDIIVSDIRMPGATGLEVLEGLRRADWATPVILITAFGDESVHAEARRLGALTVLDKPFSIERLRVTIRNLRAIEDGDAG
jgi:DNA-binding response OmpR family regulator